MEKALTLLAILCLASTALAYNSTWQDPKEKVTPDNFGGKFINSTGYMLSDGQKSIQKVGVYVWIILILSAILIVIIAVRYLLSR
jgi:hypothetical protein